MLLYLLLAVAVAVADENLADEEPLAAQTSHGHSHGRSFSDGLELIRSRNRQPFTHRFNEIVEYYPVNPTDDEHEIPGPIILRKPYPLPRHGEVDIEEQNRVIEDVFAPDYAQPTWVLDYRYLKTGGRDYARGPGGQILILPKGVRNTEHKEFPDYDTYLDHLRQSRLPKEKHFRYGDGHEYSNPHGHGQTKWRKY